MGGGERLIKGREIEMKAERETERGGGGVGITFLEFFSHLEHTSKFYTEILVVLPLFIVISSLM